MVYRRSIISKGSGNRFCRERLPNPKSYYARELGDLKPRGEWAEARCPFHKDGKEKHPSLSVNLIEGHFKCFTCGVSGGDVLAFQMKRYGQDFKTAARQLGAWEERR